MLKRIITFFLLIQFSQCVLAEIIVSINRDTIAIDESFDLLFESDKKVDKQPNFSPLSKDFIVLSSNRRSNTKILNGEINHSQEWMLSLLPNKTGDLTIPSIKFDNDASKPLTIKVEENSSTQLGNVVDDVFLEVSVNTERPYVQSQVIYTVKLYRAITPSSSSLSDPVITNGQAIIKALDNDKSYEKIINNKRYGIFERSYVIFPQTSGAVTIDPLLFQGQLGANKYMLFDPFGPRHHPIIKRSDAIHLDVQPIPDAYTGDTWLPAKDLTIEEQWAISPDTLRQGEAVTRTVILKATGLISSNLPALDNNLPDGLKHYPNQPEFEEIVNHDGVIGVRQQKMAIVPTISGTVILPALRIPWWNTETDTMEYAELPERKLLVSPSPSENKAPTIMPSQVEPTLEKTNNVTTLENVSQNNQTYWRWIAMGFLIMWLLTLIAWYVSTKGTRSLKNNNIRIETLSRLKKKVFIAAEQNDAGLTRTALLEWANSHWNDETFNSLGQLKYKMNPALQKEMDLIDESLYGRSGKQWHGESFIKVFNPATFEKKTDRENYQELEPLYKT